MLFRSLLTFALVGALLTVTPGPDSLLVLRTALVDGRRSAMVTAAGICLGLLTWGLAAALGVTALLQASTTAFTVLRWVGGAYLVWLGIGMFRQRGHPVPTPDDGQPERPPARGHATAGFRRGLLTNFANPKIGVFYLTFLPQFVPAGEPVLATTMLLTAVHVAEGLAWFVLISSLAVRVSSAFRRPRVNTWLDILSGTAFVGLGAHLALSRR